MIYFPKIPHLDGIVISLFLDDGKVDCVVIESKIGSDEGYEQLPRYAEQLAEKFPNARYRYLVYIIINNTSHSRNITQEHPPRCDS